MNLNEQKLELDLEKIRSLGALRVEENHRFMNYLKSRDPDQLDMLIQRLDKEVSGQIDCTTCANCCKHANPALTKHDLDNLSQALRMPVSEVIEKYTAGVCIKNLPCTFLKDKKCTVYAHRPAICADYPHLKQPQFINRIASAVTNYSICPIVFNVMEQLKRELGFI